MAILRVKKKTANFVIIDKTFLNDTRLSLKAKGLLAYLLSKQDDWQINVKHLVKQSSDGRDAIYSALKTLKNLGYIKEDQNRSENGKFSSGHYLVFETPQLDDADNNISIPLTENPDTRGGTWKFEPCPDDEVDTVDDKYPSPYPEKPETANPYPETPHTDFPDTGNPTLVSNKDNNNKINKEQTAASSKETETAKVPMANASPTPLAAAAVDHVIDVKLTEFQHHAVKSMIAELSLSVAIPSQDKLFREVESCLLDKTSFSQAGHDFFRKLNTIRKSIREDNWRPSIPAMVNTKPIINPAIEALEESIQKAEFDASTLQERIRYLSVNQDKYALSLCVSIKKELMQKIQLIGTLRNKLTTLQSQQGDINHAT